MKGKMERMVREELQGWKPWEIAWIVISSAVIVALSVYWKDTAMGIVSSTTGVICVVCTGKGKLSAYLFGLVNSVLYAIIAFRATYYGETMLNALYYVPMQFVGFYVWSKNMDPQTHEVRKRHMGWSARVVMLAVIGLATVGYGWVLRRLGDAMPYVDSFTTVCSVVAMVVSVKMFAEQWWIWTAVNVFTVYMWGIRFRQGQDDIATLMMWVVYLGNSLIMLFKWEREIMRRKKDGVEDAV